MAEPLDTSVGSTRAGRYGADGSGVALAEASIAAAWNVQGDSSRASIVDAAQRMFGVSLPLAPCTSSRAAAVAAFWLGPASWLLIAGDASAPIDHAASRDALNAAGAALFDVSASRVAWKLSGPHAADVLAKGCPLDFHPRVFTSGTCMQSVFGHVGVLIERRDDTFTLLVARSYARDTWHALCEAAAQYGYDVLPPATFR